MSAQPTAMHSQSAHGVAGRVALVIAHPGHELRLFAWMRATRPVVHVLTNGSRAAHGSARRQASIELIRDAGGVTGGAWGGVADSVLYGWMMQGRVEPFDALTSALASAFVAQRLALVVTDAWQLYNVAHDVTHLMARVAAAEASRALTKNIAVLDYLVAPRVLAPTAPVGDVCVDYALSTAELEMKRARIGAYPDIEHERREIEQLEGDEGHRFERLRLPSPIEHLTRRPTSKPPYEVYGEERVVAGKYNDVLRWSHVEPVVARLVERYRAATSAAAAQPPFAVGRH